MFAEVILELMFLIVPGIAAAAFCSAGEYSALWLLSIFFIVDAFLWYRVVSKALFSHKAKSEGVSTYMKIVDWMDGDTRVNGVPNLVLAGLCYADGMVRELRIPTSRFTTALFPIDSWVEVKYLEGEAVLIGREGVPEERVKATYTMEVNKFLEEHKN